MPKSKRFIVKPPRSGRFVPDKTPQFVLEQDNWNDFQFRTLYHLTYFPEKTGAVESFTVGSVKILRKGQTKNDGLQVVGDFDQLGDEFCSVGTSLDYYESLNTLSSDLKSEVLTALRDVVASEKLASRFASEAGWSISLFRDSIDQGQRFIALAKGLATGQFGRIPESSMRFAFEMPGWASPVDFDFASDDKEKRIYGFGPDLKLPSRIAVIVGKNGSGKSTLLARLARIAFATERQRSEKRFARLGSLDPPNTGFARIITIAFSPFDSFVLPGMDTSRRTQIISDVNQGVGRFVFIGLRDLAAEVQEPLPSLSSNQQSTSRDRVTETKLKSIDKLANEYRSFMSRIASKERSKLFRDVAVELMNDPQLKTLFDESDLTADRANFMALSTGHKIVMLLLAGLVANIEDFSLVLIDEPEIHLHPPLLAATMHAIRKVLKTFEAFCVIATHSPVVVQESMARHVRVVRREGDLNIASEIDFETFGESIGLITSQVFNLQAETTDYHQVLDHLVSTLKTMEAIDAVFLNNNMSHQARAYVMTQIEKRKR